MADTNQFTAVLKNNKKVVVKNCEYITQGGAGMLNFDLDSRNTTFSINSAEVLYVQIDNYTKPDKGDQKFIYDYKVVLKSGKEFYLEEMKEETYIGELFGFRNSKGSTIFAVHQDDLLYYDILNQGENGDSTDVKIMELGE